jgi:hypothetical protein
LCLSGDNIFLSIKQYSTAMHKGRSLTLLLLGTQGQLLYNAHTSGGDVQ